MIKVLFTKLFPNETMLRLMEGNVSVGWCLVMIDDRKEGKADGQALTASVTISAFVGKMHLDKV
jgi:hypothetical protein